MSGAGQLLAVLNGSSKDLQDLRGTRGFLMPKEGGSGRGHNAGHVCACCARVTHCTGVVARRLLVDVLVDHSMQQRVVVFLRCLLVCTARVALCLPAAAHCLVLQGATSLAVLSTQPAHRSPTAAAALLDSSTHSSTHSSRGCCCRRPTARQQWQRQRWQQQWNRACRRTSSRRN
jgi:hypothetical protein